MATLKGKTLFITGGSRGIGLAIALRAARDGANIAIAAKTTEPNPKLPGTIYSAADEIEQAGGQALADCVRYPRRNRRPRSGRGDRAALRRHRHPGQQRQRDQPDRHAADADEALRPDVRGQRARAPSCARRPAWPHLQLAAAAGRNPHILTLSPPLNMNPKWFEPHVAYTMAKYGMSMCVLGMAEEFRADGIAVNALWPRTVIATAALAMIPGAREQLDHTRKPEIVADAAHAVLTRDARTRPATSSSTRTCCGRRASTISACTPSRRACRCCLTCSCERAQSARPMEAAAAVFSWRNAAVQKDLFSFRPQSRVSACAPLARRQTANVTLIRSLESHAGSGKRRRGRPQSPGRVVAGQPYCVA